MEYVLGHTTVNSIYIRFKFGLLFLNLIMLLLLYLMMCIIMLNVKLSCACESLCGPTSIARGITGAHTPLRV